MSDVVLVEQSDGVATVTLNRPQARNALSSELLRALPEAMAQCEADDAVSAVVLTGADPAFCAGLDLKELGSTGTNVSGSGIGTTGGWWPPMQKPVIGAVNGPAITGGLEVALACDFLVASDRAVFGDTHARVGFIPGGGLSVRLPQAVGVRKAIEMSLTGRFLAPDEALAWGLVNHVVAHDELLPFARSLAADIAGADPAAARAVLDEYKATTATTAEEGLRIEAERFRAWRKERYDPATVEARRQAIVDRGRAQT